MYLAKNSSRKKILDYLKKFPFGFLENFSNKSWAQLYIDRAANMSAKKDPFKFIYGFLDEPWAEPYIDEAAKRAAKENPKLFLEKFANRFPQHINSALFALGDENVSE